MSAADPFGAAVPAAALEPVRDLLRADGGDLEPLGWDGTTLRLRLVLDSADCAECVMPKPFLEQVALDLLTPTVPGLTAVEIDDPRER